MNSVVQDCLLGAFDEGADEGLGRPNAGVKAESVPGVAGDRSDATVQETAPDLRWLGMASCMGSALVTLVGAAMLAGHLLSGGDANLIAEHGETPAGYSVAAGRHP